jgi:Ni/Co efflux regulator RcnB
MRKLLLLALAAATLTGASLAASPADARVVCRRICDDGFCQRRCWEERGDRDGRWDRGRDRDRDRDRYRDRYRERRNCVQVGPAVVCE